MRSIEEIRKMNNEKTRNAEEQKLLPYIAKVNNDEGVRACPFIADYEPKGWQVVNEFFVDSSGMGREGEGALTFGQFLNKVREGYGYAIKESGQFQVYINEYKKI